MLEHINQWFEIMRRPPEELYALIKGSFVISGLCMWCMTINKISSERMDWGDFMKPGGNYESLGCLKEIVNS